MIGVDLVELVLGTALQTAWTLLRPAAWYAGVPFFVCLLAAYVEPLMDEHPFAIGLPTALLLMAFGVVWTGYGVVTLHGALLTPPPVL